MSWLPKLLSYVPWAVSLVQKIAKMFRKKKAAPKAPPCDGSTARKVNGKKSN